MFSPDLVRNSSFHIVYRLYTLLGIILTATTVPTRRHSPMGYTKLKSRPVKGLRLVRVRVRVRIRVSAGVSVRVRA